METCSVEYNYENIVELCDWFTNSVCSACGNKVILKQKNLNFSSYKYFEEPNSYLTAI